MRIAVALATYNGSAFLREQFESLSQQTRRPDHVVISDDVSTDETLRIVEEFSRSVPYRVDILVNQDRVGPMEHFLQAANACEAEYIAFCDQDDIWMPRKLEICERALQRSGSLALAHSVTWFGPTSSDKQRTPRWAEMPSGTTDGLRTRPDLFTLGMALIIRKDILQAASPLRQLWQQRFDSIMKARPLCFFDHWSEAHDLYALTTARLLGDVTFVKSALARHRIHPDNYGASGFLRGDPTIAEGWGSGPGAGYRISSAFCRDFAEMLGENACTQILSANRQKAAIRHYQRWSKHWHRRATLYESKTPLHVRALELAELARMGAYRHRLNGGLGRLSLVKDTFALFGVMKD